MTDDASKLDHVWSDDAKLAFSRATGILRTPFLNKGLNAAFMVEAPVLFQRQVEGMIETITSHPVLGGRMLVLNADPDGKVRLTIDADLIRYILFDELPDDVLGEGT